MTCPTFTNGITDKDLKVLKSTNCGSDAVLDDNVDFITSDESNSKTPKRAPIQNQINIPVTETASVITSQKTPNHPINSDKLGDIKANKMAMKKYGVFLIKENSFLSSELQNKQETIYSLLETNSSLFKSLRDPSLKILPPQIVRYQMVYTK